MPASNTRFSVETTLGSHTHGNDGEHDDGYGHDGDNDDDDDDGDAYQIGGKRVSQPSSQPVAAVVLETTLPPQQTAVGGILFQFEVYQHRVYSVFQFGLNVR